MLLTATLALVAVALVTRLAWDTAARHARPNPFALTTAPARALQEGPRLGAAPLTSRNLPWTLDPVEAWPEEHRALARGPCGAARVLVARYPEWAPATLHTSSGLDALCASRHTPTRDRALPQDDTLRWVQDGRALSLERAGARELRLDPARGVLLRVSANQEDR